jgi:3-isopropylmalate/(R)-2-methylmalate dehydratase small subunit
VQPFTVLEAPGVALMRANIDTDTIIPAAWMRSVRVNPADGLFAGWRYRSDGSEDTDFPLNRPAFRSAQILVAGRNFGCGSSRENAVWALAAWGIRAVVAPGFADIFLENCFKNGLLPVQLEEGEVERLAAEVEEIAGRRPVIIDLVRCRLTAPAGWSVAFGVPRDRRQALLSGLDDIDRSAAEEAAIAAFQRRDRRSRPWIYDLPGADRT